MTNRGQVFVWDPKAHRGTTTATTTWCTDAGADTAEVVHHADVKEFRSLFGTPPGLVCEACGARFCEGEA